MRDVSDAAWEEAERQAEKQNEESVEARKVAIVRDATLLKRAIEDRMHGEAGFDEAVAALVYLTMMPQDDGVPYVIDELRGLVARAVASDAQDSAHRVSPEEVVQDWIEGAGDDEYDRRRDAELERAA